MKNLTVIFIADCIMLSSYIIVMADPNDVNPDIFNRTLINRTLIAYIISSALLYLGIYLLSQVKNINTFICLALNILLKGGMLGFSIWLKILSTY